MTSEEKVMYLSQFHIKNFRCIKDITLEFNQGLNVLIGENNSGKTAIIDALRLCMSIGGMSRKDLFMTMDDFFVDKTGLRANTIEFDLTFSNLTEEEQGVFIELLTIKESIAELQLHIRYTTEGIERWRLKYWGGEKEGPLFVHPEVLELLYYVHLGALRDAERDLRPGKGNRLSQLFLKLLKEPDEQKKYTETWQKKISEDNEWNTLIEKAGKKVNIHLKKITIEDVNQEVEIGFVPLEFKKIVESLRMQLCYGLDNSNNPLRFDIEQNGLGYNNLIYIATVLGDMLERKGVEKNTFRALLIEEPEAHLHPQLQDILFNFLNEISKQEIQIFITSHSPTVTAKADINSLTVLQIKEREISSVSLRKFPLCDRERKYLGRFLDVTKSQLFFAKGVILVEGISEALLLPVFADILGFNLDKSAIEIVNIGGTAFEPFGKLFNSADKETRLNLRCAIVTDDDSDASGETSPRATNAKELERAQLKVFLGKKTFECELYNSGNEQILVDVYSKLHKNTKIDSDNTFIEKLKQNKDKAVFAQLLAIELQENDNLKRGFKVPEYIQKAIKWVVNGNEEVNG